MTNDSDSQKRPGGAAVRPHVGHKPEEKEAPTEAGQEARRGIPPGEHDRTHESNYGGGGPNGGVDQNEA